MKRKQCVIDLPKLVHKDTVDKIMFGFVHGYRMASGCTVDDAIRQFMDTMNIVDDHKNIKSNYYRCLELFLNEPKSLNL